MEDVQTVVCRLCLKFTSIDEYQALDAVSKDILKAIVPGVDLEVSHDPKLCQTCYKTMLRCYRFKTNCKKDKTDFKKKSSTIDGEGITACNEEIEKKCGFCCDTIDNESLEDFNARKIYFDEVLQKCLPEWNLSGSTVPCKKCLETLTDQYTFIGSCLDTEDKLKHYRSTHGTNSEGKFNLYEAVRYFSQEESKESGSMTETEEEMPYDDSGREIKEEIPFPEFDVKTENIETEDVDIKSEASDEEFIGNIATSTSDISEGGEASGSVQQLKGSQVPTHGEMKGKLMLNAPLVAVQKIRVIKMTPSAAKKAKVDEKPAPVTDSAPNKRSIGIQVCPKDLIQTCSVGVQVDIVCFPPVAVGPSEDMVTSTTEPVKKPKRFKPRILRKADKLGQ